MYINQLKNYDHSLNKKKRAFNEIFTQLSKGLQLSYSYHLTSML